MGWRDRLHIFRFWANKVLPQVYDDALSYYEVLNKVAAFLNETIEKMNELIQEMEDFEDNMTNKWNAFKEQMETDWTNFQEEMKDEWKAYKVLMEETWNDFKDEINQSIQTWESETYTELVAQLQSDIATVENNLREELEAYIDGTRTVVIHVRNNNGVITADKTYSEIRALLTTGSYFIAEYVNEYDNSEYYKLDLDQGTSIQFRRITFLGESVNGIKYIRNVRTFTISVSSNNEWSIASETDTVIPNVQNASANQILRLNGNKQMVWGDETSDLPTIQSGDAGKALVVNAQGTGVEWATIAASDDVMIVHFEDHTYASATPSVHTCDKTFAEIKAHIESGKPVLAVHKNTFPTGQTTEGTTITLYYANSLPYTGTNPGVIEFVSNSLGVEQSGTTTDYAQCSGNIIRLNQDDTFTITTTSGYITSPYANAVGKFLRYTGISEFEYEDVLEVPNPTSLEVGKVLTAEGTGMYGWDDVVKEIPSYSASDAGKVLSVSALGVLEWDDIPNSEYSEALYYQAQDIYILDKTYDEILSELNSTPNGIVIKYTYNQITSYYNVVKTDGNQGFIEAICTTQTTPPNTSSQNTWDGWGVLTLTVLQITAGSGNAEAHLYNHYLHGFNPQNPPT